MVVPLYAVVGFYDTEFHPVGRLCQVAFVTIDGELLLNAIIDYGISKEQMIEEDLQYTSTDHTITRRIIRCVIEKFYGRHETDAIYLTPAELADRLYELGLSNTILVEYSTSGHLDYDNVVRCLDTVGPAVADDVLPENRNLSVMKLTRSMTGYSGNKGLSLVRVFHTLFPSHPLARQAHYASIDAIKTAMVFQWLVQHAGRTIVEQIGA